jgi:AbrB family looped-hinge helix DNA binding protein
VSAAGGGYSELSEWQRSADEAGAPPPTKMPGTATGIVRRVDDLGRIVIPKEIRRTLRIREGDPLLTTLTPIDRFCMALHSVVKRITAE